MAVSVTCDVCGAKVGAAGFNVVSVGDAPREVGDVRGEYCSAVCVQRALAKAGVRRPAFLSTREMLDRVDREISDRVASLHDLDERFMRGEYGNPGGSVLPWSPPVQVAS